MKICEAVIIPAPIKARSLNALAKDAYSVSDRIRTPSGPRRSAHQIHYQPATITTHKIPANSKSPGTQSSRIYSGLVLWIWFGGGRVWKNMLLLRQKKMNRQITVQTLWERPPPLGDQLFRPTLFWKIFH